MSTDQSDQMEDVLSLRPRFNSHRELLNHLFSNKGIELALVKQLTHANNVGMLTEIVCFILDRHDYPSHIKHLDAGSRCTELAVINFLGINHGYKPLDEQYNILFYLFSLSKPPEMIDFFRILRSRTDWTSDEFRTAIQSSPLHEYSEYVRNVLVQVTPARRHFFTLAYVVALAFNGTDDSLNKWLHSEVADADITVINPTITPKTFYQTIEHIYNELFRNAIGGVNLDLYKTILGQPEAKLIAYPADLKTHLEIPEDSECDVLPLAARQSFVRFETFALSYLSIHSNDFEIERINKELKKASLSDVKRDEFEKQLIAFDKLKTNYREVFDYIIGLYGVDLCSINEIVSVYICAKVYGDTATQQKMTEVAGIDDDNLWTYNHSIRLRFMKEPSMCNGLDDLKQTNPNLIKGQLEFFIRRNLIKAVQWIVETKGGGKTLQELAGDSNLIALVASTAVAHPSTLKWLVKQKTKLCSNSKSGAKYNVFLCALFSLGSPESRLDMVTEAFDFVTRNPAFKPELSVDEFFEAIRQIWVSAVWTEPGMNMRLELLNFAFDKLVNKTNWDKLKTTPDKYLRMISNSLPTEYFLLSDFTIMPQERLDAFHDEILKLFELILPASVAPYVAEEAFFKRIFQHAYSCKNVKLFEYLLSFNPKIEMNEFIGLAQSSSVSFDYRDLFIIPSPIFNVNNPASETALAVRPFQVIPFQLGSTKEHFGDMLDYDYCDHKILLNNSDPEQGLSPDAKKLIRGAATKAGIPNINWDAFALPEGESDHVIIGAEGLEKDGIHELYSDDATTEEYFQSDEFLAGIEFLQSLFKANKMNPVNQRSVFITMLEMLYNRCGDSEAIDGTTSDSAEAFGRIWLDVANNSINVITSQHILWTITRQLFPNRALDASCLSQFLTAGSTTAFVNKRVWLDDFAFDILIECIGASDHTQIPALYDSFQKYTESNADTTGNYIESRIGVEPSMHGVHNNTVKLAPETITNIQQYFFAKKPIELNEIAKDALLSISIGIMIGYISVIGQQKHQGQQKYMQEAMRAQRQGQPLPPPPLSFVPPSYFFDSLRLFQLLFEQIRWFPQLLLKLAVAQFEVPNVSLYGDLFDLFLSTGGILYDEKVECRLAPAGYPIMIPPEKADKFYGYYEFVVGELHGHNLDDVQGYVEKSMREAQGAIDTHEQQGGMAGQRPGAQSNPINKDMERTKSASSYVLPVILGVGAALAGLAGLFYFATQNDEVDEPVEERKSRTKK